MKRVIYNIFDVSESFTASTEFEPRDWQFLFIDYALYSILPDDPKEAASIRQRAPNFRYVPNVNILYHCLYDDLMLHFMSDTEMQEALKEASDDIWGAHQPSLKFQDLL